MNPFRWDIRQNSSPNRRARTATRRLFSARGIITKVNGIFRRFFSKANRESPAEDIFQREEKEGEDGLVISHEESNGGREQSRIEPPRLTIDTLPDEMLLEVFDCHRLLTLGSASSGLWEWHRLAHVCRRWRTIVFSSPQRLDLRLVYTYDNPLRESADCWPSLPISIWYPPTQRLAPGDEGNVVAALGYPDRICEINLTMTRSVLAKSFSLLRASFPALERLYLRSQDSMRSLILPTAFLGGAAPRLRDIHLDSTAFPMLPQVLLSAHELVSLQLENIPNSGYVSPDSLANSLSATTRLEYLGIFFLPPMPHPNQRSTASPPHAILPALTNFQFKGEIDYLGDLVTKLDAPALERLAVSLFEESSFDISQLIQFVGRTQTFRSPHRTSIELSETEFTITHDFQPSSTSFSPGNVKLRVSYDEADQQMLTLVHICRQLSALLATPECLDIVASPDLFAWRGPSEADSMRWVELFRHFLGVKRLGLSSELAAIVASAFEQVTETSDTLPSLREIHMSGSRPATLSSIERFAADRERSGYLVSVHYQSGEVDT